MAEKNKRKASAWLRDMFLYGGLSKEEYRGIVPAARKSNLRNCRYIALAMTALMLTMAFASVFSPTLHNSGRLYLVTAVIAGGITALTFLKKYQNTWIATAVCYLAMLLGYGYGFGLTFGTRSSKDTPAVTFVALIVLVPLMTTDVLWRICVMEISILGLFLYCSRAQDLPQVFSLNLANAGAMTAVGILFYIIISSQNFKRMAEERRVRQISLQTVQTLANAIDAKDRYTNGHSYRVSEYSVLIARELGWSEEEVSTLQIEALLHDIGKIGIPDTILNKPGRLTDIEYRIVQSHTELGAQILQNASDLEGAREVALYHHERYDGRGYPTGTAGKNIPAHARVVTIADSYDAMNSDRIYRRALSADKILEELRRGRGTQFDPEYLDAFLRLLEEGRVVIGEQTDLKIKHKKKVRKEETEGFPVDLFARDVETLLEQAQSNDRESGAFSVSLDSFSDLYAYVRNVGNRYNLDVNMILMNVEPAPNATVKAALQQEAVRAMELAIRTTIRNVDICAQCSSTQVLVIFLGAGKENLDMIIQRIYANYYKIFDSREFALSYKITDQ